MNDMPNAIPPAAGQEVVSPAPADPTVQPQHSPVAPTPGAGTTSPVLEPNPAGDSPQSAASSAGTEDVSYRDILNRYERIIEQSLAREDQLALALFQIQQHKLYKLTHTAFAQYCKERWGFKRSRGYQLIRFARQLLDCQHTGQRPPANERQARSRATDGTLGQEQPHQTPYDERFERVTRYLARQLHSSFSAEPLQFVADLRSVLDVFEKSLRYRAQSDNGGVTAKPSPSVGCTPSPRNVTSTAHPAVSLPPRPVPQAGAGSLLGLSMEQARTL